MTSEEMTLREVLLAESYQREIDELKKRIKELEELTSSSYARELLEQIDVLEAKLSRYAELHALLSEWAASKVLNRRDDTSETRLFNFVAALDEKGDL